MIEFSLQNLIGLFSISGTNAGQFLHFRVEIDVEMVGLHNAPVEFVVVDLVSAKEELCGGKFRQGENKDENGQKQKL